MKTFNKITSKIYFNSNMYSYELYLFSFTVSIIYPGNSILTRQFLKARKIEGICMLQREGHSRV